MTKLVNQVESGQENIGRRELLKTLTVASGAVIVSQVIPSNWIKPLVESGVLPAHAATSATATPRPTSTSTPEPGSTATATPPPEADVTGRWIIEITVTALSGNCSNHKVGEVLKADWTMTQTGGEVVGEVTKGTAVCDTRGKGTVAGNKFSFLMTAYSCCIGGQSRLDATTQGNDYFSGFWTELDYPLPAGCCTYNGTVIGRKVK